MAHAWLSWTIYNYGASTPSFYIPGQTPHPRDARSKIEMAMGMNTEDRELRIRDIRKYSVSGISLAIENSSLAICSQLHRIFVVASY